MSYIVPRDKPIACKHCGFMDRITYDCKLLGYKDYPDFATQYANCPLVEIPQHWRLIDADALVNECEKYIKSLNPERDGKEIAKIRWLVGILNEQPTIIEVEGREE